MDNPENTAEITFPSTEPVNVYDGGRHGYRKPQRRADAAERAASRAGRSSVQQLARLDALLGKGVGAMKERARLSGEA